VGRSLLLRQIGEHPFITVRQLCRMLDVSKSWVYGRLSELDAEGLVGKVNPRHPGIRACAFYYLTPDGEARLSLPRRAGRPRFLERIATVYEVRNLFISAQRARLPVSRWQVLTLSTQGVSLHGAALTADGRRLIVEWDRGERPLRLYRYRLRRLAAIAAETGAGLLVVAADEARGTAGLSILAGHLNLQGPHLGLTTRIIIATQGIPAATCYVPAVMKFISLGGFVETLPEPWGGDLPVSLGVKSFTGKWRGMAQLVLELSPLQKVLLSLLASLPLVEVKDLAVLAGRRSEEWVRRALIDLKRRGLVGIYVADPNLLRRYHYLTCAGLAFLAAGCGAQARAYARARGWVVGQGKARVSHLKRVFEHTQGVREVFQGLTGEAARHNQTMTWHDEGEARIHFTLGGERRVLAPAARVCWGDRVFFVEIDRGTAGTERLSNKVRTYNDFQDYAEHSRFSEQFRLLIVAPHPHRERQWLEQVSRLSAERRLAPLDVLTTTQEAIRKRGIGAPIWRRVQDVTRRVRFTEGYG
jgi:DNA-binding MarR family transcriptional regulator